MRATLPPELTFAAVATGLAIGLPLALSNIYLSLKIGFSDSSNLTAVILSFGLLRWADLQRLVLVELCPIRKRLRDLRSEPKRHLRGRKLLLRPRCGLRRRAALRGRAVRL